MASRGGARPGAGRKKGDPQRLATREQKVVISDMAKQYAAVAIASLVRIAKKSDSDAASVTAANALLDRGFGKARQEVTGANGGPLAVIDYSKLTLEQIDALEPLLVALAASSG